MKGKKNILTLLSYTFFSPLGLLFIIGLRSNSDVGGKRLLKALSVSVVSMMVWIAVFLNSSDYLHGYLFSQLSILLSMLPLYFSVKSSDSKISYEKLLASIYSGLTSWVFGIGGLITFGFYNGILTGFNQVVLFFVYGVAVYYLFNKGCRIKLFFHQETAVGAPKSEDVGGALAIFIIFDLIFLIKIIIFH
jgi:uncharacterized membrane protein